MFSLMMLALLLSFVPSETVRRFVNRVVAWVPAVPLHRLVGAAEGARACGRERVGRAKPQALEGYPVPYSNALPQSAQSPVDC